MVFKRLQSVEFAQAIVGDMVEQRAGGAEFDNKSGSMIQRTGNGRAVECHGAGERTGEINVLVIVECEGGGLQDAAALDRAFFFPHQVAGRIVFAQEQVQGGQGEFIRHLPRHIGVADGIDDDRVDLVDVGGTDLLRPGQGSVRVVHRHKSVRFAAIEQAGAADGQGNAVEIARHGKIAVGAGGGVHDKIESRSAEAGCPGILSGIIGNGRKTVVLAGILEGLAAEVQRGRGERAAHQYVGAGVGTDVFYSGAVIGGAEAFRPFPGLGVVGKREEEQCDQANTSFCRHKKDDLEVKITL